MHDDLIDSGTWRRHAWLNRVQSLALLGFMGGFLALLGWLLSGIQGVFLLLVMGGIGVMLNPSLSPRWVMRLYGASRLRPQSAPWLAHIVDELAGRAPLPATPALYYVPSANLNAFAVASRRQSAIALSDGLLRRLDVRELAGVLAHEIGHIRNNDLWVMGLADMFSRATSMLSLLGQFLLLVNLPLVFFGMVSVNWFAILLLIFAPTVSALAQLALSRTREYDADLNAVRLTGDADGLASALLKIEQIQGGWLERILLPGRRIPEPSLLRTHPETSDRIARLMTLKPRSGRIERLRSLGRDPGTDQGPWAEVRRPPRWHISGLWH